MKIEKLKKSDAAACAQLAKDNMPYAWNEAVFQDCFKPNYLLWKICDASKIIAFLIAVIQVDSCELLNLCVAKEERRKGFASQFLNHLINDLKEKGILKLFLEVRVSNTTAIRFYETQGFELQQTRHHYYPADEGREDAACLLREL